MESLVEFAPAIAHDLPGGVAELRATAAPALAVQLTDLEPAAPAPLRITLTDVKFGTATRPFHTATVRLHAPDERFAGSAMLITPGLPGSVISLLGTGDHATLEKMLELLRPARRPGAVMFVDLVAHARPSGVAES